MTRPMLDSAARSVTKIGDKIEEYAIVAIFRWLLTNYTLE